MSRLAPLSLQHVTGCRTPRVPTPDERMAAYNATRQVVFANTRFAAATGKDSHNQFDPPAWDEVPRSYADRRGF